MRTQFIIFIIFIFLFSSCGKEQGDVLTIGSTTPTTGQQYIMIGGADGNHRGVTTYDIDGNFISGFDLREENQQPRGFFALDNSNALLSVDTTDGILIANIDGTYTNFHGSNQFNGDIRDIVRAPNGNTYALESNGIEVFDADGIRLTNFRIGTTTGSCVLNAPRGMILNANNELVVVNAGGSDDILTYDISTSTATCVSAVSFGSNPYGVLLHSDGSLYITTQGDDRVYRADPDGSNAVVVWETDTSIINNPTGIVEMPNGDLLVASSATDTIERITTSGTRVGDAPFIRDVYSLNIIDMVILGSAE